MKRTRLGSLILLLFSLVGVVSWQKFFAPATRITIALGRGVPSE